MCSAIPAAEEVGSGWGRGATTKQRQGGGPELGGPGLSRAEPRAAAEGLKGPARPPSVASAPALAPPPLRWLVLVSRAPRSSSSRRGRRKQVFGSLPVPAQPLLQPIMAAEDVAATGGDTSELESRRAAA